MKNLKDLLETTHSLLIRRLELLPEMLNLRMLHMQNRICEVYGSQCDGARSVAHRETFREAQFGEVEAETAEFLLQFEVENEGEDLVRGCLDQAEV